MQVLPQTILALFYLYFVYKHHMVILYVKKRYNMEPDTIDIIFEWIPVVNIVHGLMVLVLCNEEEISILNILDLYMSIH
jgi:hypothetical protein